MEELMTVIDTQADEDEDLQAALPGGLWREHAPQRVVMSDTPYGRYFVVSDVPLETSTTEHEEIVIQFDMFTRSPDSRDIWNCDKRLKAAFPNKLPIAATLYNYIFWRRFSYVVREEGGVYHCIVEYRVQCIQN